MNQTYQTNQILAFNAFPTFLACWMNQTNEMNKIDGLNDINGRNRFHAINSTNSMNPINATNAITTFLSLCNPLCASLSFSLSEVDWNEISRLAQWHGLTPFFFHRMESLGISLPEELRKRWIGSFLFQMGQERKARQQIRELKEILDPEGSRSFSSRGHRPCCVFTPIRGSAASATLTS